MRELARIFGESESEGEPVTPIVAGRDSCGLTVSLMSSMPLASSHNPSGVRKRSLVNVSIRSTFGSSGREGEPVTWHVARRDIVGLFLWI